MRAANCSLRHLHCAGEHLDHDTRLWAERAFGVPCLDHWWQTESGWPISAPAIGYGDASFNPPKATSGRRIPGWNVQILGKDGKTVAEPGELGRIVVKMPLPPGVLSTFWENDEKFARTYFEEYPGYYDTMDAGIETEDGWLKVMARVDDVINVAGHRLSTGGIEEAILNHPKVADCAVVGIADKLKGHIPLAMCVHVDDWEGDEDTLAKEIVQTVRANIGAVAALKTVLIVPKLPKTRSGKIARNTLAAMAEGKPFKIPVTIEDDSVYPIIKAAMRRIGLAKPIK